MTKLIAETVGATQLIGAADAEESIPFNRPAVVRSSYSMDLAVKAGRVRVLREDVADEASDAAFGEHWAELKAELPEGEEVDTDLAIDSYLSELPAPEAKPTAADKAKDKKGANSLGQAPKPKADGETYKNPSTASDLKA